MKKGAQSPFFILKHLKNNRYYTKAGETMKIKEIEELLFHSDVVSETLLNELQKDERIGVQKLLKKYEAIKKKEEKERQVFLEKCHFENGLRQKGIRYIAGVDEVGRGPLAGPVVSCAVILPETFYLPGLTDSKKLTKEKREQYYEIIKKEALALNVSFVSAAVIDEINIYEATKLAMAEAVNGLSIKPEHLLIDALRLPLDIGQTSIIKGDNKSISIAASSIVAKVERDRYMEKLGKKYPQYGFERHMGYPTKEHVKAIQTYGITPEHRTSYRPVREAMRINK